MSIKDELQRRMDAAGLNPNKLALKAKVTQATVWRILAGESMEPRESTVTKLAKFFGVSNDVMWGRATSDSNATAPTLPPDQAELLAAYAMLDNKGRLQLLADAKHRAEYAKIEREETTPHPRHPKERRYG